MKTYFIVLALPLLMACESGTKKTTLLEDSLSIVNVTMNGELDKKDSVITNRDAAITEFLASFNEISENLKKIKIKQNILSTTISSNEFKVSEKDQILNDIQFIYDQMNQNKKSLASVRKQLKNSTLEIKDLEKAMAYLNEQLLEKDTELENLRAQLEKLDLDLSNLRTAYSEEIQKSDDKTELLNTAYYTMGTAKELEKKKIITKTGGFIGLGKTKEINKDVQVASFNKIDVTKFTNIPLNQSKKVKLITPHPSGSYQLIKTTAYDNLEIIDSEKFWKDSKYLVIQAEK